MKTEAGNKIKYFRLLKGYSQEKMAELLGISPKSYGNIERNITDVNLSRLQQIADTLEISLPRLLDFDEKNIIQGNNSTLNYPNHSPNSNIYTSDQILTQENAFLKEKNALLESQIQNLQEIVALLKTKNG